MAIIGLCRSVVTALVVLVLAYVNCSPLRAPRQVSNPSIGVLHETLDVAKNILRLEFNHLGDYKDIPNVAAFQEIVHNITKMAELQTSVNDLIENLGENASRELNATKLLLDKVIDNSCSWIKSALHNETFSCSAVELHQLNLMFEMHSVAKDISSQLTVLQRSRGIRPCEWIYCNIACNSDIDPAVVEYITNMYNEHARCIAPGQSWTCPVPFQCPVY